MSKGGGLGQGYRKVWPRLPQGQRHRKELRWGVESQGQAGWEAIGRERGRVARGWGLLRLAEQRFG